MSQQSEDAASRIVLGGHSFHSTLGSDPIPSDEEAREIVRACLDRGIVRFDTTYAPERRALGGALEWLGRRPEATVLAWNFFDNPDGPARGMVNPRAYEPDDLPRMLEELRTDWIDVLVVHPVDDQAAQQRQVELAISWREAGLVRSVATWSPEADANLSPYVAVIRPLSIALPDSSAEFARYRAAGCRTYAASPFVRGWELDRAAEESGMAKAELADRMLRYAAFAPDVDYVIVAMRRAEWVAVNVDSVSRGPLGDVAIRELALLFGSIKSRRKGS